MRGFTIPAKIDGDGSTISSSITSIVGCISDGLGLIDSLDGSGDNDFTFLRIVRREANIVVSSFL